MTEPNALTSLHDTWKNLTEDTRKHVFQSVCRSDAAFLKGFAAKINGFSLKGLLARPVSLAPRLDQLLFTMDQGQFAYRFMINYFIVCDTTMNDQFLKEFSKLARSAPKTPSKQISERVLASLGKNLGENEFFKLYSKALRFCAPERFSEEPPNLEDLES